MPQFKKLTPNLIVSSIEGAGAVDTLHDRVRARATVVMPLTTQWYGMREFAIEDPDGFVITFAQRIEQQ